MELKNQNHWKPKKKTYWAGYLTDAEATEMEGLMVEAQADYEYLLETQKKKDADYQKMLRGMRCRLGYS